MTKASEKTKAAPKAPAIAKPKAGSKPNALQQPLQPSDDLAAIIGEGTIARGGMVRKIWAPPILKSFSPSAL